MNYNSISQRTNLHTMQFNYIFSLRVEGLRLCRGITLQPTGNVDSLMGRRRVKCKGSASHHSRLTRSGIAQLCIFLLLFNPNLSCTWQISRLPQIQALGMTRFDFDDFKLDADEMVKASLRLYMDLGLLQKFKIDTEVRGIFVLLGIGRG